jgi:uncharacterized protein
MQPHEQERYWNSLLAIRERLTDDAGADLDEIGRNASPNADSRLPTRPVDDAREGREWNVALENAREQMLEAIDLAFARVNGRCEACVDCGREIAATQLDASTFAVRCVACERSRQKHAQELRDDQGGPRGPTDPSEWMVRDDERTTPMALFYHEPASELSPEARDIHRALASLVEELEAVDWYHQRSQTTGDESLKAVLRHNRDEEIEHAAMMLEWLRRRIAKFDEELRTYLFTSQPIMQVEDAVEEALQEASLMHDARASVDGDLGLGQLDGRHRTRTPKERKAR